MTVPEERIQINVNWNIVDPRNGDEWSGNSEVRVNPMPSDCFMDPIEFATELAKILQRIVVEMYPKVKMSATFTVEEEE